MKADIFANEKLNLIATELFIRVTKLNISHVFIPQSYFAVQTNIRLKFINCFRIKIQNKQ